MRSTWSAAALAVCLAASLADPAVTRAQPYSPLTPVAFTGFTRSYTVAGCGSGPLSYLGPSVPIFCLTGTATTGVATSASGTQFFQTVLDLTGTRLNGFAGTFYDIDYSGLNLDTSYRDPDGSVFMAREGFRPAVDPTGRTTFGYIMFPPVDQPGLGGPGVAPDGFSLGSTGEAQLGYVPAGAPGGAFNYGHYFPFALTITETPEPATLALTLGGLAVLGAGAWRRRRAV